MCIFFNKSLGSMAHMAVALCGSFTLCPSMTALFEHVFNCSLHRSNLVQALLGDEKGCVVQACFGATHWTLQFWQLQLAMSVRTSSASMMLVGAFIAFCAHLVNSQYLLATRTHQLLTSRLNVSDKSVRQRL